MCVLKYKVMSHCATGKNCLNLLTMRNDLRSIKVCGWRNRNQKVLRHVGRIRLVKINVCLCVFEDYVHRRSFTRE